MLAVLLDIEGTTTSISFVYETLFPFARANLARFLEDHWGDPDVRSDVEALRAQAVVDASLEGAIAIPAGFGADAQAATLASVLWQMDTDRKTTGLKSLQGKIWHDGYVNGVLRSHLFDDVAPALSAWEEAGIPVHIYSSGSIAAQKLLFGHSSAGDLRQKLAGYYDTTLGPKKSPQSYRSIAEDLRTPPSELLFATDSLAEADAADAAGLKVVISVRPGNHPLAPHSFREIRSLLDLV